MSELTPKGESSKKTTKKTSKKTTEESKEEKARRLLAEEQNARPEEMNFKRRFKGEKQVFHDLYRLEITNFKKNVGWDDKNPLWESFPHKHFFHTVDSDGRPQHYATPSNGHTHKVTYMGKDDDGNPIYDIGPAVIMVNGKPLTPRSDKMIEHGEHKMVYLQSHQVTQRKYDEEFVKKQQQAESDMTNALKKPQGVK